MSLDSMWCADDIIVTSLIIAEPKFFNFLKRDLKKQLSMMPENEKYRLKQELHESRDKTETVKKLGIALLEREFIH